MKTKIFIFSSLLCMCGAFGARASDCTGPDCDIQPMVFEEFEWTQEQPTAIVVATPTPVAPQATWMESDPNVAQMPAATVPAVPQYAEPVQLIADYQIHSLSELQSIFA